jgi:tellurite resistance protein
MADSESSPETDAPEPFAPEGAEEREKIRMALDESALALQRDRVAAQTQEAGKAPTIKDRVRALGFEEDAAKIFDLLPLVHVAWADGKIQAGERAMILQVLQVRGLASASGKAFKTLEALLESPPSQTYLEESLSLLKDVVGDDPKLSRTIVGLCVNLAEAAGGFLGLMPVSSAEKKMIARIADALGPDAQTEFQKRFG